VLEQVLDSYEDEGDVNASDDAVRQVGDEAAGKEVEGQG
jgi:hypothetical protein